MTVYTLASTVGVVGFLFCVAWLVGWIADRLAHREVTELSREDALRIAARRPLRGEAPRTGADAPARQWLALSGRKRKG